jgi:large subunit ribosomal protein L13
VVIVNADKVAVTGRKETEKMYFRHTNGRPGGGKMEALRDLRQVSRTP